MPNNISYKDLPIWQRAMQLVVDVYQLSTQLPATERLGLSGSLQQIALSIPTGLASGTRRGRAGFRTACLDAQEANAEIDTLLLIIQQVYPTVTLDEVFADVVELERGLATMVRRLSAAKPAPKTV